MYSTDGAFFNEGLEYGTTYYVYSAALLAPFGSLHNDECSDYSDEPQEIAFYQEMSIADVVATCSDDNTTCLLYTSPSPRDLAQSRMPSSA